METKKISISIFQIFIIVVIIIALVVVAIVVKDLIKKNTEEPVKNVFLGTGTKEDAYQISKIEDLINFSINLNQGETYKNQYFILNNSIDFQDDNSYLNPQDTSFGDLNNDGKVDGIKQELTTGQVFIKVGSDNEKNNQNNEPIFEGNFNGNGKIISNLIIDVPAEQINDSIGLFYNNQGIINDLKVVANIVIPNVSEKTASIGIIAGKNSGTIQKCKVEGEIIANTENVNNLAIAGVVGENTGNILDSSSDVNISSNQLKAGITAKNTKIDDIENSGEITNCTNNGTIVETENTDYYTAGIVAINEKGKITSCTNTGRLEAKLVAGVVGKTTGDVVACTNTGSISNLKITSNDDEITGGIAGTLEDANIENCKNGKEGRIKGLTYIGGIVAQNKGYISLCTNEGELSKIDDVKANTIYIGGISGVNFSGSKTITSKNYGNINSKEDTLIMMGGICGNLEANSIIDYCENNAFVDSYGRKIHRNLDTTKKCNSCKTGGGGKAIRSATGGELFIGLIYGNAPGIEEVEILEIEGEDE